MPANGRMAWKPATKMVIITIAAIASNRLILSIGGFWLSILNSSLAVSGRVLDGLHRALVQPAQIPRRRQRVSDTPVHQFAPAWREPEAAGVQWIAISGRHFRLVVIVSEAGPIDSGQVRDARSHLVLVVILRW